MQGQSRLHTGGTIWDVYKDQPTSCGVQPGDTDAYRQAPLMDRGVSLGRVPAAPQGGLLQDRLPTLALLPSPCLARLSLATKEGHRNVFLTLVLGKPSLQSTETSILNLDYFPQRPGLYSSLKSLKWLLAHNRCSISA
ncbi:hypothetical protein H1C71_006042 [Ictidomys tridecemlineatus]|nr:hypothetical protein H1C71_006042 [Ictidomys tridecemlineatus]